MMRLNLKAVVLVLGLSVLFPSCSGPAPQETKSAAASDPLASWNDGETKSKIVDFVKQVTTEGGPNFVPVPERIATFDNDGTMWSEQPIYVQFQFALERAKEIAPQHPEWKKKQPFQALIEGDKAKMATWGEKDFFQILVATHSGMTVDEFNQIVKDWLATAKHPKYNRPYTELAYKPMLELLSYLRSNGFKTFIVSGGTVEFMRPWMEQVYGIPPEQIVGSTFKTQYQVKDGQASILRMPEIEFIDDHAGKPVGISKFIGRRPIAAFGNSDGDFEMLEYAAGGKGLRLAAIVHHTDEVRETAYDRKSSIGRLDRGLDEAGKRGWLLIDMKKDFKQVFAFQQ